MNDASDTTLFKTLHFCLFMMKIGGSLTLKVREKTDGPRSCQGRRKQKKRTLEGEGNKKKYDHKNVRHLRSSFYSGCRTKNLKLVHFWH